MTGFYYKRLQEKNRIRKKGYINIELEKELPECKTQFLFIIGMKRSGTSMMVNILNMHPNICITMESDVTWIIYQLKILGLDIKSLNRYYLDGERGMKNTIIKCEKEILNHSYFSVSCFMKQCIEKIGLKKNNLIIGDKKPLQGSDLELFDFVESELENITYIHMWRDKKNVVRSWVDLTKHNPPFWLGHENKIESLYHKTQRDCRFVKEHTKGKYIKVEYNNICKNPKKELTRLFKFLDSSFAVTKQMIDSVRKPKILLKENEKINILRICGKCHIGKDESDFYFNKNRGYFDSLCKKCQILYKTHMVIIKKRKRKELYKKYGIKQI